MQYRYYLIIKNKIDGTIQHFMLYDEIEEVLYSGNFKIKDSKSDVKSLDDLKRDYHKFHRFNYFEINKETFEYCLDLEFGDLKKNDMKSLLLKLGLYEYAI